MQIGKALADKNLGIWCQLMQHRLRYLPYHSHPVLAMARRLNYVDEWQLAITPPENAIHLIFHLYMHVAYIGITTVAFITRLRKHMTDATSCDDCATLHPKLSTTDMSHWGLVPLQLVTEDFQASVRERHWWYVFRRYALNDVPPGINGSEDSKEARGFLNKRVLAVLHGIHEARGLDGYPRLRLLKDFLRMLTTKLSVPLQTVSAVCVPNLTSDQKAVIHTTLRQAILHRDVPAWERQALLHSIRVVRTNPHTCKHAALSGHAPAAFLWVEVFRLKVPTSTAPGPCTSAGDCCDPWATCTSLTAGSRTGKTAWDESPCADSGITS